MIELNVARIDTASIDWPAETPIEAHRVLVGAPAASTLVIESMPGHDFGLWRVTPGVFLSDHTGYTEYIHVLSGAGRLIDENNEMIELGPGVTVLMQPGWKGKWVVEETITKVYTVINA